jgi:hypothetical protein
MACEYQRPKHWDAIHPHNPPPTEGGVLSPLSRVTSSGSKTLRNLPRATQLPSGGARTRI